MRSAYAEEARWLSGLGIRAPQRLVRAGQPRQARPSFRQSARPRRSSLASSSPNAAASPCRRLRPLGSCWRLASSPHCIVYLFRGEQHDMLRASCYNESHTLLHAQGVIKRTYFIGSSTSEYINDVLVLYFTTPLPLGISANIPGACEKLTHL